MVPLTAIRNVAVGRKAAAVEVESRSMRACCQGHATESIAVLFN